MAVRAGSPGPLQLATDVEEIVDLSPVSLISGQTQSELERVCKELFEAYDGDRDERGRRHGHGTFKSKRSGSVYTGMYDKDKKHGWGKIEYKCGDIYEGNFTNNKKNGQGTYSWVINGHGMHPFLIFQNMEFFEPKFCFW